MDLPKDGGFEDLKIFPGYQWGELLKGVAHFHTDREGEELEITAALPTYLSNDQPCDLIQQFETARRERSQRERVLQNDPPHIRFANSDSDDDLISFVRAFGPGLARRPRQVKSEWRPLCSRVRIAFDSGRES